MFGVFFKSIGLLVVLVAAAAADKEVAVAAVLTYAAAYTLRARALARHLLREGAGQVSALRGTSSSSR